MGQIEVEFDLGQPGDENVTFTVNWPSGLDLPRVGEWVEFDSAGGVIPDFQVNILKRFFTTEGEAIVLAYATPSSPFTLSALNALEKNPLIKEVSR